MNRRFMTGVFLFGLMLVLSGCGKNMEGSLPAAAAKTLGIPVEKTLPKSGIVLRLIPAGTFVMGSPESEQDATVESVPADARELVRGLLKMETQHKVTISKPFYIGKYEVTQDSGKR